MRSFTQSLAWIARQTRLDLCHRLSKIQSTFENVLVRDSRECERLGICIVHHRSWKDPVFLAIHDANFCQETQHHCGITQHFKSQQTYITALAPGNAPNADKMIMHPLCWSPTRVRRGCRSTFMAETHALFNGFEHGLRLRAALVDMKGRLIIRRGGETASASMGHDKLGRMPPCSLIR